MKKNQYTEKAKSFWKNSFIAFVLKNLLAAIAIILIIVTLTVIWLKRYTEHGIEVEVPEVTGMYIEEAKVVAEAQGLHVMVIDSTYSKKVPYGSIVEQNPQAGRKAKHGRSIYLIINAKGARQVVLPDLHDNSYRQAESTLATLGIQVEEVVYEPSEYRDIVLDVLYKGVSQEPGTKLTEGCQVTLVVGQGKGTEMVSVPNIQGMTLKDARALLRSEYLTIGAMAYDEAPTEETKEQFVIYSQDPAAGTMLLEGSGIDVSLSTDLEKAATANNDYSDEDFF
ncbi:MAG: PASTA domain-containing protein [Paludibacteraceae bacterium]|nr:PASTA domain-containing protein [Paludibacteraceae bacterium]